MNILIIIVTSLILLNHSISFAAILKCDFRNIKFNVIGEIYVCNVQNNGIFDGTRVSIDSIEGQHASGKSNDDIQGIHIVSIANVNFIPSNMHKHFKNMNAIYIYNSQVQEISQTDLQPYPNLIYIALHKNNIKVIEKDTFKFNRKMRAIYVYENEISHVDYDVFNGLDDLETLALSSNKCKIPIISSTTKSDVIKSVEQVKAGNCIDFDELIHKIVNLESRKMNELIEQKYEKLSEKIDNLTSDKQQLISEVKALTDENSKLKNEIENLNTADEQLKIENQAMRKDLSTITSSFKFLKTHIDNTIYMHTILYKQLMASNDQLTSEYKTITDETNQLTIDITAMKPQINTLNLDMKEVKEKQQKLSNQVDFIEVNTIRNIWKEINDLKKADGEFAGENVFINLAIQELNNTNAEMRIETRTIIHEIKDLKLRNYDFKEEIQKIQVEQRKLQEKIQSVENQLRNLVVSNAEHGNTEINQVGKGKSSNKVDLLDKKVDLLSLELIELKKCCP